MVKKIILMFIGLFLISLASADINLDSGKQGECITLQQTCDTCTWVNISSITRTGENSTTWNLNKDMTKFGVDYNYSFCQTNILGDYVYSVYGNKGGGSDIKSENGYFTITPTGDDRGFGLFLVLIIASVILFVGSFQFDLDWGVFLSGVLFILSGIYAMIYGLGNLASLYTRGIAVISIGLGMVFIIASLFNISKGEGVEE